VTHKIDRYIFWRLVKITVFVLLVLIFVFIVIDFSENSDDFTDKGATVSEIFGQYYFNYIPEMIRLVIPVAVFVACLYLTGQMSDRLEIVALKAAGVSLYRLIVPFMVFAFLTAGVISYLDGFVIPDANSRRIAFEKKYIRQQNENLDKNKVFRQDSVNRIFKFSYYNPRDTTALNVNAFYFKGDSIELIYDIRRMQWRGGDRNWAMYNVNKKIYTDSGIREESIDTLTMALNIYPADLARTTSDIYQLTYPEAQAYIESIHRSGATGISLPQIQFYGRLAYPLSILVVTVIGFAVASVRRPGGKGFYITAGLIISFLYLVLMKVIEPFGKAGEIEPLVAAMIPHLFFLIVGIALLIGARK